MASRPEYIVIDEEPSRAAKTATRRGITSSFRHLRESARYTNYSLKLPDGTNADISLLINAGNASDQLESTTLQTGESASGALYFEVPADVTADQLAISYTGYVDSNEQEYEVPFAP
jgi:hypothetical protein